MICTVDGCGRPVERIDVGLCAGHRKRKLRGAVVNVPLQTPKRERITFESILELALTYADATEDDDYERVKGTLRKAIDSYGRRQTAEKIRQALKARAEAGLPHGPRPTPIAPEMLERVRQGEQRLVDVAKTVGLSRWTVRRRMRKDET